ncbi:hypothetical protein [Sunxiuqinia rutila]
MRKLSTNEKFLISFILILLLAIAFNWKNFSKRLKEGLGTQPTEQVQE